MTFEKWVMQHIGRGIDYDGTYGVQCVDLAKHYIKNVLGVKPESIGNAIEYYNKRKTSEYLTKNFKWIDGVSSKITNSPFCKPLLSSLFMDNCN